MKSSRILPGLALASLAVTSWAAPGVVSDPIEEVTRAVARFRGIGDPDVKSYTARFTVPDEEDEPILLLEVWRSPGELSLGAADASVPRAIVRSWALFLEPMFVARTSLLGMDLEAGAERLRRVAVVSTRPRDPEGSIIELTLPLGGDPSLPDLLRDVERLRAELDGRGRIQGLDVELASGGDEPERIRLDCTYDPSDGNLPHLAVWTLPDGQVVRVETTFRDDAGRRVPDERLIVFPSRWDPGEEEEIVVRYGAYDFTPTDERTARFFRYDANGLVEDPN